MFEEEIRRVKADIEQEAVKSETLCNLDCFILDNSIREEYSWAASWSYARKQVEGVYTRK